MLYIRRSGNLAVLAESAEGARGATNRTGVIDDETHDEGQTYIADPDGGQRLH